MFKLVRDRIPELVSGAGEVCNFAQIKNPELMTGFLREKLVEEVNEFLTADPSSSKSLEELVDIVTVVRAIYEFGGLSAEEFEKIYQKKLEERGGLHEGFIMFIPDPVQQGQVNKDE